MILVSLIPGQKGHLSLAKRIQVPSGSLPNDKDIDFIVSIHKSRGLNRLSTQARFKRVPQPQHQSVGQKQPHGY